MRRAGWAVAVMAAAVLGGCGSDDDPMKPPPGPSYPALTSPQHVLEALLLSYQSRDSTEYDSLYDHNYVGTSTDLNDNVISTFLFNDEIGHMRALARSTTISSIVLDFGPLSSWTRLASDDPSHPEWAVVQIPSSRGDIYDGQTSYTFQPINPMTFAFTPTVAAPGDTTWKIIRWTEVGQGI
jgi:hypothetical protein